MKLIFLWLLILLPVLSHADISSHSTLSNGLVSYWELEENTGARLDSQGLNDLTDNNTVLSGTGIQGTASDLEQVNSEYLSSTASGLAGLSSMSFQAWVKVESFSATYPVIASKWQDSINNRGWALALVGTQPYFYISQLGTNATLSNVTSGVALSTGIWYHLVGTFNGSTGNLCIYVNNSSTTNATSRTGVYNSSAQFDIGQAVTFASRTDGYFDGLIDEAAFWNRELTASEVSDLYNSGLGLAYSDQISVSSSTFRIIPYNNHMPLLETINCGVATCTLSYATSTNSYLTPESMLALLIIFIASILITSSLTFRFL